MSDSVTLHSKLGVNPRIVYIHCRVCGEKKSDSLVLLGASNYKEQCPECKTWVFGGFNKSDSEHAGRWCPKCKGHSRGERVELSDTEHIESNGVCSACQKLLEQGIAFISVKDGEKSDNPYRTGKFCVIKQDAVERMPIDKELKEGIIAKRVCFIEDEVWSKLGFPTENVEAKTEEVLNV